MDFPDIVLHFPFLNPYFSNFLNYCIFLRFGLLKFLFLIFVFQFLYSVSKKIGLSSAPLPPEQSRISQKLHESGSGPTEADPHSHVDISLRNLGSHMYPAHIQVFKVFP